MTLTHMRERLTTIWDALAAFVGRVLKIRSNNSNILILAFKLLGDTVFTIPAIQKIIDENPDKKIIICCYDSNKEIYELVFNSLDYLTFKVSQLKLSSRQIDHRFLFASLKLRELKPAIIFDMTACWKSALLSTISGASRRVGFGNVLLKGFYDFFNPLVEMNQIEMFLKPVKSYYKADYSNFKFSIPNRIDPEISICIIPFAGWKAKEWNLRKYIALAENLSQNYSVEILYESGKMEKEVETYLSESCIPFTPTNSIKEMIGVISKHSLIISNDTGPLYISYLLGKYSFGIFGPTNPDFHIIDFQRQKYIQKILPCSPKPDEKLCFTFGGRIGCPAFECMNHLEVQTVIDRVKDFILEISDSNS